MNGKYMKQAELRWVNRDAERLEHIRKKREKRSKRSLKPPKEIALYEEGDLYDDDGRRCGSFCGLITYETKLVNQ